MDLWESWKKGYYRWENTTAKVIEGVLRSPLVLQPTAQLLTTVMQGKTLLDKAANLRTRVRGGATKRDQERTLHKLNQLESKLFDLEEHIEALKEALEKTTQH